MLIQPILEDVKNQMLIQKWLILVLLKGAFGGSSDTTLKGLQEVINKQIDYSYFLLKNWIENLK